LTAIGECRAGVRPALTAQARVTDLVTGQLAKMLAAELRQEAAKLAHQNALLRQSAQQPAISKPDATVLKHP